MNEQIGAGAKRHRLGQADAQAHIAAHGLDSAKAKHVEMLPRGVPCDLSVEDFQYWSGWWAATFAADQMV